ncbi:hypothetical protein C7E18_19520, partial [Stenotrophomonas maltophilia]
LAAREARLGGDGLRVSLPMGRGDIADHLGLTMERISRTFTKLRQQGLIALPHLNVVEILDEDGLISCCAWPRVKPGWAATACACRCRWAEATSPTIWA